MASIDTPSIVIRSRKKDLDRSYMPSKLVYFCIISRSRFLIHINPPLFRVAIVKKDELTDAPNSRRSSRGIYGHRQTIDYLLS